MSSDYMVDEARLRALATNKGGWVAQDNQHYIQLAEHGYAETDGVPDADGDIFYQLTELGTKWIEASHTAAPPVKPPKPRIVAAPAEAAVGFAAPTPAAPAVKAADWSHISSDVDTLEADWNAPQQRRFNRRNKSLTVRDVIDFDSLPIGGSRHIACTTVIPEPWKKYSGVVSNENKRHATIRTDANGVPVMYERKIRGSDEVGTYPKLNYAKRFILFRAHDNDPKGPGARVMRVDPAKYDGSEEA